MVLKTLTGHVNGVFGIELQFQSQAGIVNRRLC
jgi:hypothetical protein